VGSEDSKKEKSASAHASMFVSAGAAIGAGGVDGRTVSSIIGEAKEDGISFSCSPFATTFGIGVCHAEKSSGCCSCSCFGATVGT
jgi:hypothetical protein